jgi:hypothetical protein
MTTFKQSECTLAYGLESQFGRKCSRAGGDAVCGACIGDINAPAQGFGQKASPIGLGSSSARFTLRECDARTNSSQYI